VALTYIYGHRENAFQQDPEPAGIDPNKRTHALLDEEIAKIRDI
jgi:ribosomal protein S13